MKNAIVTGLFLLTTFLSFGQKPADYEKGKQKLLSLIRNDNPSRGKWVTDSVYADFYLQIVWYNVSRSYLKYDGQGRQTEETTISRNPFTGSTTFENSSKTLTSYNASGYIATEVMQSWNPNTRAWVNDSRINYSYTGKNPTARTTQFWDTLGGRWLDTMRTLTTYNVNDLPQLSIQQQWFGGAWVNDVKDTFMYDTQKRLVENISYQWIAGVWEPLSRTTQSFEGNFNEPRDATDYNWNGNGWDLTGKTTFTYNASRLATIILSQNWDTTTGMFVNSNQALFTYDANGNQKQIILQIFDNNVWENFIRVTNYWREISTGVSELQNAGCVMPNPWQPGQTINCSGLTDGQPYVMNVFDLNGRLLHTQMLEGGVPFTILAAELPASVVVRISTKQGTPVHVQQLLVMRP